MSEGVGFAVGFHTDPLKGIYFEILLSLSIGWGFFFSLQVRKEKNVKI